MKSSPSIWRWRLCQFLWPSQKTWTLKQRAWKFRSLLNHWSVTLITWHVRSALCIVIEDDNSFSLLKFVKMIWFVASLIFKLERTLQVREYIFKIILWHWISSKMKIRLHREWLHCDQHSKLCHSCKSWFFLSLYVMVPSQNGSSKLL